MTERTASELLGVCVQRPSAAVDAAWSELLERYGRRIHQVVRRALRRAGLKAGPDAVEELAQELYCRLLGAAEGGRRRFQVRSDPEAWGYLARTAYHLAIDRRRAAAAEKRRQEAEGGAAVTVAALPGAATPGATPEERLLAAERRRLFLARCRRAAVGRRPALQVEILRLALFEGWASDEIARRLGGASTRAQVDSVISRMRRRLRRDGVELPRRCPAGVPQRRRARTDKIPA